MNYRLQDLVDLQQLQQLQDRLNEVCPFPSAIIDNDGTILTATAWQDICTQFHRQHPACRLECIKSDQYILAHLAEADPAVTYRCPHGLIDNAMPIIVGGEHLANFFTGQFFLEPPDEGYFRAQAQEHGFDEAAYLAAVRAVPIWSEAQLRTYLLFIRSLIDMMASVGLKHVETVDATRQLEASERQFRAMFETASIGVAQADIRTGKWLRVNQRMCEITGYTLAEMLSIRIPEITHPDDRELDWDLFQQVVRGEQPSYRLEKRYLRKDGRIVWVNVNMTVTRDDDGEPVRTIATIEDITERKEREAEILRLNRLYRAMSELNELITHATDEARLLQGACDILVSQGGLELAWVGWPDPESHQISPVAQAGARTHYLDNLVVHADDRPSGRGPTGTAIREGHGVIWNDWSAVPAGTTARPLPADQGIASSASFPIHELRRGRGALSVYAAEAGFFREKEILLFEKAAQNIGYALAHLRQQEEKQRAEELLHRSHERHRAIIETSVDGFLIMDTQGRILEVNDAYCAMSGYTASELVQMQMTDLEAAETAPMVAAHIADMIAAGSARFETRHRRKDGSVFDLEVSVQYRPEEDLFFGFQRDITDRKRAEAERAELEAQLAQAQRMEAVGRLAGGVAHDFNNLLTVISGHAEMALREVDPAHLLHDDLVSIRQAAQRSADLTRQLLAFARQQTISPKVLDLNEAIANTLRMLQRLIGEDIRLEWSPANDLWPVKMDPSQLDQVLANLCVNARDAIQDVGRVSIRTGQRSFDEAYCAAQAGYLPGDFAYIAVSDTGCGIAPEALEHIFEPFFTTKEVGKGTGLGLATVYGAVRQNHGFVRVSSQPGHGTTFTVYLPRCAAPAAETGGDRAAADALRGTETILLVEDEPSVLRLASRIIQRQGYHVLTASSPVEALAVAKEQAGRIRLLVTDLVMPEMNGRDLAAQVREACPGVRVIFMSGYTADVIGHHGVLDEGVAFVQKPFDGQDLTIKIREVLDRP